MDRKIIGPARGLVGPVSLPGDKSISHRLAILASLAEGTSTLGNYSLGEDCRSTLACLRQLGVDVQPQGKGEGESKVLIAGRGLGGYLQPPAPLDAGNSGTTMRLLAGALAGCAVEATLSGDESLHRRPMDRVVEPLRRMGARIETAEGGRPPLVVRGGALSPVSYEMPMASAQVKSAVLLAGLHAEGTTEVIEPVATRDHTELALKTFGADVECGGKRVRVKGRARLEAQEFEIPGDLSAAAFLLVGAMLLPESNLMVRDVGLNPTRTALLDFLAGQGADIKFLDAGDRKGELVGQLNVRGGARLKGGEVSGAQTAKMIDELPVLAVLGALSEGGLRIRDAAELRVKESDRIRLMAEGLRRMGARVEESSDGLSVEGGQKLRGGRVESGGDHRIAMSLAIAGLLAEGETVIGDAQCADVSFPGFFDVLESVRE